MSDDTPAKRDSDAAILAQFREWQRAWKRANQSGLGEKECAEACDVMSDMLVALAKMPATGGAGLAVKLAALFESRDERFHLRHDPELAEHQLWFSLIADAGRLAPELAPLAAEVAALAPQQPEHNGEEASGMAQVEFEPVDNAAMLKDFSQPVYSRMMHDIGIDLRLAAATLGKTKPELVAVARGFLGDSDGGEALFEMMDRLADTRKRLQVLVQIVEAAHIRLLVAAGVIARELESAADGGETG
ncbi:MAG TPA: hypothetical protein VE993_16885 [Stellaceae bacterium]|nr:hypothetical protein [Stellaceae bacterium]